MIKVSFCYNNILDDVCNIIENNITNQVDIEEWLMEKVTTIKFACMDFSYDLVAFYDCYFVSNNEESNAYKVYSLLKRTVKSIAQVECFVYIVDDNLDCIKEISN